MTALQFFHIDADNVQVDLQVQEANEESSGYVGHFNSDDDNEDEEVHANDSGSYDDEEDL